MHHWSKRNRSTSWVPSGPARSNDAFLRSVVAGATIPSIICSSVLPECMVVGQFLPLYVSLTGQHNPKSFVSVSTPLISKMRTFFKKSASMFLIKIKYRIEQRRPIFDSPQNKTKNFLRGSLVKSVGVGKLFVWDFPYYNLALYSLHTNLVIFKLP